MTWSAKRRIPILPRFRLFQQNRQYFVEKETVSVAHVVVNVDHTRSEEQAENLISSAARELESGVPFAEVVERYSDCKGNGGELDSFPRGAMVPEFENVVFSLAPGERSSVFRTPFGFHIAEVRAAAAAQLIDFEKVKPDIERFLKTHGEQQRLHRALVYLRSNSVIVRSDQTAA